MSSDKQSSDNPENISATNSPEKPGRQGGSGGFVSHLLASVFGALLGIFGLSYAGSQNMLPEALQFSGSKAAREQVATLVDKVSALERQISSGQPNSLSARLEKTEAMLDSRADGIPLAEKIAKLENKLKELEKVGKTGDGGQLAGLAAVTRQLEQSSEQNVKLQSEFTKLREEQAGFRKDLAAIRSQQADYQTATARIEDELARLKNSTAKIVANASRPPDVSAQLNPVVTMLGDLAARVDGIIRREANLKAEGRDIALALSLGELKRALNEGMPYKDELARLAPHVPKGVDISVLKAHADKGLVTINSLQKEFPALSNKVLSVQNTPSSGSLVDQLFAGAKSMIQVRPTGLVKGDTTGAVLARMEYRLNRGDLAGVLKESGSLDEKAAQIMKPWLDKARAKLAGDTILRTIEDKIRNALAGAVSGKG